MGAKINVDGKGYMKKKPTRREISDVIVSMDNIFMQLDRRIRGLEYAISEYFKFQNTEDDFEKYLKEKKDEEVKESDAKAHGRDIQTGSDNKRGGSE